MKYIYKVFLLIMFLLAVGCDNKQDNIRELNNQSTPQECLGKFYNSIKNNDFNSFRECFSVSDTDEVKSGFNSIVSAFKFAGKIEKEYGKDCWEEEKNITIVKNYQTIFAPQPYSREDLLATIEINGNKAKFFFPPHKYSKYGLIKKGNNWYYDHEWHSVGIFTGIGLDDIYAQIIDILDNNKLSFEECMVLTNIIFYKENESYDDFREALLELHSIEMIEKLEALCELKYVEKTNTKEN